MFDVTMNVWPFIESLVEDDFSKTLTKSDNVSQRQPVSRWTTNNTLILHSVTQNQRRTFQENVWFELDM